MAMYVTLMKGFDISSDADTYYNRLTPYRNSGELTHELRNNLTQSTKLTARVVEHQPQFRVAVADVEQDVMATELSLIQGHMYL